MNVLKVKGKKNDYKITKIFEDKDLAISPVDNDADVMYLSALDDIDHGKLSTNDMNVLIYITGYVACSVSKSVHCQYCACHLCLENDLNVELQSSEYFNLLDRGGLKWPTNFVMTSCVNTYCIFE